MIILSVRAATMQPMSSRLGTVVVTGAAGRIGSAVRQHLRDEVGQLVLVDRVLLHAQSPVERAIQLDLADLDAVVAALEGADTRGASGRAAG